MTSIGTVTQSQNKGLHITNTLDYKYGIYCSRFNGQNEDSRFKKFEMNKFKNVHLVNFYPSGGEKKNLSFVLYSRDHEIIIRKVNPLAIKLSIATFVLRFHSLAPLIATTGGLLVIPVN